MEKSINQAAMKIFNDRLVRPDVAEAFDEGDEVRFVRGLKEMVLDEIKAWSPDDVMKVAKDIAEREDVEVEGYEDSFKTVAEAVGVKAVTYGDRWWHREISEAAKDIHRTREGFTRHFWVYKKCSEKKTTLYLGTDPGEAASVALHPERDPFPKHFDDTIFMEYKDIPSDETEGLTADEVMEVWKRTSDGDKIPKAVWHSL